MAPPPAPLLVCWPLNARVPQAPEVKLRSGSADNVDADVCQYNWFHHNTFRTYGNECVDVKEGSTNNLVENNVCEQQQDENSGGFGLRGSANTVRFNEIAECKGAGVRVGGDKGYGIANNIYGNVIMNAQAGFNVMSDDHGAICENQVSGAGLLVRLYSCSRSRNNQWVSPCRWNFSLGKSCQTMTCSCADAPDWRSLKRTQ